jgi:hypothetical protein
VLTEPFSVSADAAFAICPGGSSKPVRRKRFEEILKIPPGLEKLSGDTALAIWTADLLFHELPDHADGIWLWLQGPQGSWILNGWNHLVRSIEIQAREAPVLAVAGSRYIAVSKAPGFDIAAGEWISQAPEVFDTRLFNLRMLFLRSMEKATKWTQKPPSSGPTPIRRPSAS